MLSVTGFGLYGLEGLVLVNISDRTCMLTERLYINCSCWPTRDSRLSATFWRAATATKLQWILQVESTTTSSLILSITVWKTGVIIVHGRILAAGPEVWNPAPAPISHHRLPVQVKINSPLLCATLSTSQVTTVMNITVTFNVTITSGFYRAMHYSAQRGIAIACHPSVRLSVTLVDQDHIGWKSWKLMAWTLSPTPSLFGAQRSSTYSQGNMRKFGD